MIEVKNLTVERGKFAVRDVTFDVQDGEYFVLLGPTGAGKTVLLESIAGLNPVGSGQLRFNGKDVTFLSPEKRNIGFAYQDHVLFPHLSVRENIAFGLEQRGKTRTDIQGTVAQMAELLTITHLLERRVTHLSGGESQKVALARALAIKPDLLLLDEPLSAVDPETREAAQRELREIHNQLQLTTIHVTHDFEEAIALGDRIAVMGDGTIVQIGTSAEIFRRPNSEFVARFVMTRNIIEGEVLDGPDRQAVFRADGTELAVVTELRGKLHASIRPEDILISQEPLRSSALNSLQGTIDGIADRGSVIYLTVNVPPQFTCLITRRSYQEMALKEEQPVFITFKASAVHVF